MQHGWDISICIYGYNKCIKNLSQETVQVSSRGTASDLYAGGTRSESLPGHRLS
jgi:hypothetical protein